MLPYLQRFDMYNQFKREEPWDSEQNKQLIGQMPEVFKSPLAGHLEGKTVYLLATGPETLFSDDAGTAIDVKITDGPANTIMLVEVDAARADPLDQAGRFDDHDKESIRLPDWHDFPNGSLTVVRVDAAAHVLPGDADPAALWSFFTRAGGEKVDWPQ